VAHLEGVEHAVVAEKLDVSDNVNVSTVGGKRLRRLCQQYHSLCYVLASGCSLNTALERKIEEAAAENLALRGEGVSPSGVPNEDTGAPPVRIETSPVQLPLRADSPDATVLIEPEAASPMIAVDVSQKTPQTEPRNGGQQGSLVPSPPRDDMRKCRAESTPTHMVTSSQEKLEFSVNLSYGQDPEMQLPRKSAGGDGCSCNDEPDMTSRTLPPDLPLTATSAPSTAVRHPSKLIVVTPAPPLCFHGAVAHRVPTEAYPLLSRLLQKTKTTTGLEWPRMVNLAGHCPTTSSTPRLDALMGHIRGRSS
jgi:hypothetical protein